jgi:hypothetical protein
LRHFFSDDDSALSRGETSAKPALERYHSSPTRHRAARRTARRGERITLLAADGYPLVATCYL